MVETRRVTAFDLLVELTRARKPQTSVAAPADLALDDFTVLWDGAPLSLVGLATGADDPEPWRLVIYIDRVLSSNHTVRWAAMELAERARRLSELGEVEIIVAEPELRRALAPTRDSELIDNSLSGVFLAPAGTAELVSRREEFLIAYPDGPHDPVGAEIARRAADDERLLVRRQTDRLLGWIVAPLAPPAPPVGAGRFGAFVLPDVTFPWLFAIKLRSLEVWLDGNRKPKKADALTELGHTLRRQGRLQEAVEAYKKAVYHYYDHPTPGADPGRARRDARAHGRAHRGAHGVPYGDGLRSRPRSSLSLRRRQTVGAGQGAAEPAAVLVSWASVGPEAAIRYCTRATTIPMADNARLPLEVPEDHLWLALLVEAAAGRTWGGSVLELPGG